MDFKWPRRSASAANMTSLNTIDMRALENKIQALFILDYATAFTTTARRHALPRRGSVWAWGAGRHFSNARDWEIYNERTTDILAPQLTSTNTSIGLAVGARFERKRPEK